MKVKLYAPAEYWNLSKEEKEKICNGCGAKDSILSSFIPDGVFKEACNIHDYMYHIGRTDEDRDVADRVFINNMNRIVDAEPNPFIKKLKALQAKIYYTAVRKFGIQAFWKNKTYPGLVGKDVEIPTLKNFKVKDKK